MFYLLTRILEMLLRSMFNSNVGLFVVWGLQLYELQGNPGITDVVGGLEMLENQRHL